MQTCVPPTAIDQPAAKLSQTGCMDPTDTKKMAASVIPYEVNSPLWSDGADKTRGLALPTGGKIHVKNCATTPAECPQGAADDGKWVLPVGTVMVKSFLFDGKLVETRLFVHFDADDVGRLHLPVGRGADRRDDRAPTSASTIAFNTGTQTVTWHYPEPHGLHDLPHADAAGSTLGPETAQMNRVGGRHEPDRSDQGAEPVRDARPPSRTRRRSRSRPDTAGRTLERSRALVPARELRLLPPTRRRELREPRSSPRHALKDMNACGANPERGNQGVPTSLLLTPGMPSQSLIVLRMMAPPDDAPASTAACRTSPATSSNDAAVNLISDWITSITSCPQ